MIIPDFWAEARRQHRAGGKQVTVRRFGWSNTSEVDAQVMAQTRADEALQRILAGEKLGKREPKVPYNGAVGVPIREEVIARHGEHVITRNSYGARCLNSPNLLIADIDDAPPVPTRSNLLAACAFLASALVAIPFAVGAVTVGTVSFALLIAMLMAIPIATWWRSRRVESLGGARAIARASVDAFIASHPAWSLRVYETPAGLRVIATHRTFEANTQEVKRLFDAVGVDPMYARMCFNQHCFRARLTAKPWRIGIATHMRPRPGTWPVRPERLADRAAWIAEYEAAASAYAACRYVGSLGSGAIDNSLARVIELHDVESRALVSGSKIA